ncbi:heavy metal translocating P-type ATPase [Bordetella genomosp. 13]|uniref:P-type Zn(2+) transporter n=2 Tax=Bordetella genomosp. 13 TaxID=463040 RepID=A0A1W6ZD48_9BORD|nr:heavy metal translocating P-type ATPase [Bordetella genomosp. 13]ARP95227.1 heavy metal translocating P-type ATPase [Bordetella genomosp. 13]
MTEMLRLELPIILPGFADAADKCVDRLVNALQYRPAVEKVHIKRAHTGPAQLCIQFDPRQLPLARIRAIVDAAGAEMSERIGHAAWRVKGITHMRRAATVAVHLRGVAGVFDASVDAMGNVRADFDRQKTDEEDILYELASMNVFPIGNVSRGSQRDAARTHDCGARRWLSSKSELAFSLACGGFLGLGVLCEELWPSAGNWVPLMFFLAAYTAGGIFTLREALDNLRMRRIEIDTLMLVAAAGAAAIGAWDEGALLLFLFSLGHALERYAMGRAKRAIEALAMLVPDTATVRRGGLIQQVPVRDLVVGDIVSVRSHERLAADGFVLKGTASVDQSAVTGESIPVDKRPVSDPAAARERFDRVSAESRVFAGTVNRSGVLEVEVMRLASDSTLTRVVQMVSEATVNKSPTQRTTDRFERILIPGGLLLAVVMLFSWVLWDEPIRDSFYRSMAVLVAASPCALAIATSSAVLSGIARAARSGVLIKGGAPLEALGGLEAIAFDKSGTLTQGRPRITEVVSVAGVTKQELLAVAVAVEERNDHPLASAITRDGRALLKSVPSMRAEDVRSLPGRGLRARIGLDTVLIGKAEMFGRGSIAPLHEDAERMIMELRGAGRTTVVVRRGDQDLGVIGLSDTLRSDAWDAVQALRGLGISRIVTISGDHQRVVQAVAREVGLEEAWGDLMPQDKVDAIQKLRAKANVAMVGDGVNDAPAMASADVAVAMGAAGSDVALETADVALLADDLRNLPFAVGLSRRARAVIRQNVYVSLGVVAILVPATMLGMGIGATAAIHGGSTLLVVTNALRLLAYRSREAPTQFH